MQPKFKGQCYNCNKYGHKANECRTKSKFEGNYFTCHKQGHNFQSADQAQTLSRMELDKEHLLVWTVIDGEDFIIVENMGTLE